MRVQFSHTHIKPPTQLQLPKERKALLFRKPDKIVNVHIILSEGYEDSYIFVTMPFAFLLNQGDLRVSYRVVHKLALLQQVKA